MCVVCFAFRLTFDVVARTPTPRGVVRLKLGLFVLLTCGAPQIRTKSAKVGDGRPARSRAPGGPSTKRSSLLRPGKAAKDGAQRASTKRSSLSRSAGGPKAAKVASSGRSAKRSWLHRRGKAAEAGGSLGGRAKLLKSRRLLMSTSPLWFGPTTLTWRGRPAAGSGSWESDDVSCIPVGS